MEVIFSYSLYGNESRYYENLYSMDMERILNRFPDAKFRVYYDGGSVDIKNINCLKDRGFEVYDYTSNELNLEGMFARYIPITETDKPVVVRDTDSEITDLELNLLNRWLNSPFQFHIIRGHVRHIYPIMGGLFSTRGRGSEILRKCLKNKKNIFNGYKYNDDQKFLARYVYPEIIDIAYVDTIKYVYYGEVFNQIFSNNSNFIGQTTSVNDCKRVSELQDNQCISEMIYLPRVFHKIILIPGVARIVNAFEKMFL